MFVIVITSCRFQFIASYTNKLAEKAHMRPGPRPKTCHIMLIGFVYGALYIIIYIYTCVFIDFNTVLYMIPVRLIYVVYGCI